MSLGLGLGRPMNGTEYGTRSRAVVSFSTCSDPSACLGPLEALHLCVKRDNDPERVGAQSRKVPKDARVEETGDSTGYGPPLQQHLAIE